MAGHSPRATTAAAATIGRLASAATRIVAASVAVAELANAPPRAWAKLVDGWV
jgi:hypothetical protein